jgi:NAD(P)-dependent dehydrogenase (short-subunit alcohol dehydrogenase family)
VICEKFAAEGANVVINYANSKGPADELAKKLEKYGTKIIVLKAVR